MINMAASKEEDNLCAPCLEDGDTKKGTMFCVDCGLYYCDGCLVNHNKFPALRKHKTVHESDAVHESGSTVADESTEECHLHRGQILTKFCYEHDELCCPGCLLIKHRNCANTKSLEDAAKGTPISKEHDEYKDASKKTFTLIQEEQKKRRDSMASLEDEKTKAFDRIEKRRVELIERIQAKAEESKREVEREFSECVKASDTDCKALETLKSVHQNLSTNIKPTNLSDVELFVRMKRDKDTMKTVNKTINEMSDKWQPQSMNYCLYDDTDGNCFDSKTFGFFVENVRYRVNNRREIDVKQQSDKNNCTISGICKLEDGTYFLSDSENNNVKRISKNDKIVDSIGVNGWPIAICVTDTQEVAVALREEKKIQFISCGQRLSLGSLFSTGFRCHELYFDSQNDELYVSCGVGWDGYQRATVNVYLKDGSLMRSYENDGLGSKLFKYPNGLNFVENTQTLFVADCYNGLIAISTTGKLRWVYKNEKLKGLCGLCLLPGNQLLVTDYTTGTVLQIGADGKEIAEIIGASDKLNNPYCVFYDKEKSLLMIGCESNEIYIYQIHRNLVEQTK